MLKREVTLERALGMARVAVEESRAASPRSIHSDDESYRDVNARSVDNLISARTQETLELAAIKLRSEAHDHPTDSSMSEV